MVGAEGVELVVPLGKANGLNGGYLSGEGGPVIGLVASRSLGDKELALELIPPVHGIVIQRPEIGRHKVTDRVELAVLTHAVESRSKIA